MQPLPDIKISIQGKEIRQFNSLIISQSIFQHHKFRLTCPVESIDGTSGSVFHLSKDLVGAEIRVKDASGFINFLGLIIQVEAAHSNGHDGDIIFSGFSPTILLDNGIHCKTWDNFDLKNIASDVLSSFNSNLLKVKIAPDYKEKLGYTVQYKETAWQFLNRITGTYGDWLFYDGENLIIGPPDGNTVQLMYGRELDHFRTSFHVEPINNKMIGFDYLNNEVRKGKLRNMPDKTGLNDLGKFALDQSRKFYDKHPKQWANYEFTDQKQLDGILTMAAARISSGLVKFDGRSTHLGIQIGGSVHVEGQRFFNTSFRESPVDIIGDYRVISVEHFFNGQREYSNEFHAIPLSIKTPPVLVYQEPMCETQSALVTDNYDKEGLGRVRVRFHWMKQIEKTPWMRIASPHGGNDSGMYFRPEIGDEVIVEFEGGRAVKPIVIGTVYNGEAKTKFGNDGNYIKALRTISGNTLLMNDKEGSVNVCDAKGNDIMIDGKGNINITSSESLVLTCGDSRLEMKKDGTIKITGKKIITSAKQKARMISGLASFTADGQANTAKMEGVKSDVTGSAEIKINGGSKTEITAEGDLTVKATLIALN